MLLSLMEIYGFNIFVIFSKVYDFIIIFIYSKIYGFSGFMVYLVFGKVYVFIIVFVVNKVIVKSMIIFIRVMLIKGSYINILFVEFI